MKSEVTPSVGMLLWWSVSWAGKLYRIITSSVREKHPAMLTIQSTLWERDCQGLHHFLPSSLLSPETQHGCRKNHRMWQIHLQCHLIKVTTLICFFTCKVNPAERSCGSGNREDQKHQSLSCWRAGMTQKATSSKPATLPQRHCHSSTYFLSEGFSLFCATYSVF